MRQSVSPLECNSVHPCLRQAESSTGTNVNVCTTDDFTKSVDALVYYIDPDSEEMKLLGSGVSYFNTFFWYLFLKGAIMT